MKKLFLVLACAGLVSASTWAIGVGVGYDFEFYDYTAKYTMGSVEFADVLAFTNTLPYVFVDLDYIEASVGILIGTTTTSMVQKDALDMSPDENTRSSGTWAPQGMRYSVVGKYPVDMGGVVVAAYLGGDYTTYSSIQVGGAPTLPEFAPSFEDIFLKAGFHADYKMDSLLARFNLGLGYSLSPNHFYTDTPDWAYSEQATKDEAGFTVTGVKLILGASVGFAF